MRKIDTVRALRDSEYRNSLTADERALLPTHPAGASTIADDMLKSVAGGCSCTVRNTTWLASCVAPGEACP